MTRTVFERSVISSAAAGDTVNFSCSGTITLTSTITLGKNVTIDGSGQTVETLWRCALSTTA
jgi:hypothetical protein